MLGAFRLGVALAGVTGVAAAQVQIGAPVTVTVDPGKVGNILAPRAFGIHTSVYDNDMGSPEVVDLLKKDGIYTLRYPGGGYADIYHWSDNKLNNWKGSDKSGYLAKGTDFGSFVRLLDKLGGTAVLTVNYGTNLKGDGPGEPEEAAAWVAYCNGKPDDARVIGKGASGEDWKTVGYWAAMRTASPLPQDDGYNFLRLHRAQPLNIKYWEIGNELFGNGYYLRDGSGYENDRHGPYTATEAADAKGRYANPKLSPTAYGQGVVEFSKAMKAVDPRIAIGAVLNTPPMDYSWGPDWNHATLKACAAAIDFVIVHWYTGDYAPPDYKQFDSASLLKKSTVELPQMIDELLKSMHEDAAGKQLQLAVTEINARPYAKPLDLQALGMFAADAYASLGADGAINIDWLELHSDSFLKSGDNKPQSAYFGIQMAHKLIAMRETFVDARTSNPSLVTHAARHADGSVGLMLINSDPKSAVTVKVKVAGEPLAASGTRYDWGPATPPEGSDVQSRTAEGLGNSFTLSVPAYGVTVLSIPKKSQ